MKAKIIIEQFDNGITLKWKDVEDKQEPQANVALDSNKEIAIGRMIWDEVAMPGYGLYDRALGATYLNGLWEAIVKSNK